MLIGFAPIALRSRVNLPSRIAISYGSHMKTLDQGFRDRKARENDFCEMETKIPPKIVLDDTRNKNKEGTKRAISPEETVEFSDVNCKRSGWADNRIISQLLFRFRLLATISNILLFLKRWLIDTAYVTLLFQHYVLCTWTLSFFFFLCNFQAEIIILKCNWYDCLLLNFN